MLQGDLSRGQEIASVIVYNDKSTNLDLDISKLKPFSPLTSIPRSRTAEWRRGYEKPLNEFNN